jgi:NitT/TauT family transport system substrate-binding protein
MSALSTKLRCALALGASLASLHVATASAATPVTVVLGYIPDVESFGAYYAKAKGYFTEAGLDVTLIPAGTGIDQVQMVDSGQATIGIANPEQVLAATDKGVKLKVFASEFQTTPVSMTCRKDANVTKPADLKGKRLGVKQNAELFAKLFLSKNGLSMADVTPTTIGGSDISLIIAGRIDCMITTFAFNEPALIEQAGVPVTVLRLGDYGLNAQTDSYFVKADWYADAANQPGRPRQVHEGRGEGLGRVLQGPGRPLEVVRRPGLQRWSQCRAAAVPRHHPGQVHGRRDDRR